MKNEKIVYYEYGCILIFSENERKRKMMSKEEKKVQVENIQKTADTLFSKIESIKNLSEEEHVELLALELKLHKAITNVLVHTLFDEK